MNTARLTRRWQEAAGDPARMVEALVDEINDPAAGLVTRAPLRAELAQVRGEIARVRGKMGRVGLTVFGTQVVLIAILATIPSQVLR